MAKLVDLLAKHLVEWPDRAKEAMQNQSESSPEYMRVYFYGGCGDDFYFDLNELAEDASHACVTKSQFLAARDRLHADTVKEMRETANADADQALWDKVAINVIVGLSAKDWNDYGVMVEHSMGIADAFMAERAKRMKGGV